MQAGNLTAISVPMSVACAAVSPLQALKREGGFDRSLTGFQCDLQVTSGAVTVGRQKLFHQHVLNSSPLKMQINSGSPTTTICSESRLQAQLPYLLKPCSLCWAQSAGVAIAASA